MATYSRPGVYVEESLTQIATSVNDPGAATAAFVGTAARGPVGPTVVTTWRDYVKKYGDLDGGYLGYAVWLYFANGGRAAWISRAIGASAVAATASINNINTPATTAFAVTANSPGVWGNKIYVSTPAPGFTDASRPGRFDFVVKLGGTGDQYIVERFSDVSLDPTDDRNFAAVVNSPDTGSKYVTVAVTAFTNPTTYDATKHAPAVVTDTVLTTGSDGGTVDYDAAVNLLDQVDDVLVLNIPGKCDVTTITNAKNFAATKGSVFIVVDSPTPSASDTPATATTAITAILPGGGSALPTSSLLAVYGPWITVPDPRSSAPGASVQLPAGGAVVGKFISTDALRGVQKPAAGVQATLSGVLAVAQKFTSTQQDTLFSKGFNLIKPVPGAGYCIWGARTLSNDATDRAVSVRRTLLTVKAELVARTRFGLFEPNNPVLWDNLTNVVEQYLNSALQAGMLKGTTPSEAYYVKCDSENNPPASVAAGEVHIEVGIALNSPAEFVVISIGQFDGAVVAEEV